MDPVVADELPRSVGRVARLKLGKSNVHRLNASRIYIEISMPVDVFGYSGYTIGRGV